MFTFCMLVWQFYYKSNSLNIYWPDVDHCFVNIFYPVQVDKIFHQVLTFFGSLSTNMIFVFTGNGPVANNKNFFVMFSGYFLIVIGY